MCVEVGKQKKVWLEELDNRIHISEEKALGFAKNASETIWVMWHEFARNESADTPYWWMNLGCSLYDEELIGEIKKLYELKKKLREKEHESIAEILLVADEENMMLTTQNSNFHIRVL